MKITLVKPCKHGKPGDVPEVANEEAMKMITEGVGRWPSAAELTKDQSKTAAQVRKELGLQTIEELCAANAKADAAYQRHVDSIRNTVIIDHGISKDESIRRERAAKLSAV